MCQNPLWGVLNIQMPEPPSTLTESPKMETRWDNAGEIKKKKRVDSQIRRNRILDLTQYQGKQWHKGRRQQQNISQGLLGEVCNPHAQVLVNTLLILWKDACWSTCTMKVSNGCCWSVHCLNRRSCFGYDTCAFHTLLITQLTWHFPAICVLLIHKFQAYLQQAT